MFDRFLSWFGLARRSVLVEAQKQAERADELRDEVEGLRFELVMQEKEIGRGQANVEFYSEFFDRAAYMNRELRDIHKDLEGMLS